MTYEHREVTTDALPSLASNAAVVLSFSRSDFPRDLMDRGIHGALDFCHNLRRGFPENNWPTWRPMDLPFCFYYERLARFPKTRELLGQLDVVQGELEMIAQEDRTVTDATRAKVREYFSKWSNCLVYLTARPTGCIPGL